MNTVLSKLINEHQTGFMPGRYIGDNLRLIYDLIAYIDRQNLPCLLLNIDLEKAFDLNNIEDFGPYIFMTYIPKKTSFGQMYLMHTELCLIKYNP